MLIVLFNENEEPIFQQTVAWLSSKFDSTLTFIKQKVSGFHLDPFTRTFINENEEEIYLTAKEFDLLYFLFCHKGQVFSKEYLYDCVWGYDYALDGSNLTSFIPKLRKKIEPDPNNPKYILTVWGVSYKFTNEKCN